ncbi:MAG: hypothetical protein R2911_28465 [Caldilineaceae bacterium]
MVLLDTNIFVIDRFFQRDERYADNQAFVNKLPELDAGFSIFSLLELCGISSFNLSESELKRWMFYFPTIYPVKILNPHGVGESASAIEWFGAYTVDTFQLLTRKITWGDAMVVQTAEQYQVDAIITWNQKHFVNRTTIPVLPPREFST